MDRQYTTDPEPARRPGTSRGPVTPEIVVVGAAARDLASADPRGWRLGGGVAYGALTTARLGLRTAALIGADGQAAGADELALLRDAGVEVRVVPLDHGPVFRNEESPAGRRQTALVCSDPVPVAALPTGWRDSPGWLLAPVADELPAAWSTAIPEAAFVALGWQGLLRELRAGEVVRRRSPAAHALLDRADLVGLGGDDVEPGLPLADLVRLLRIGATLILTQGDRGGLVVETPDRLRRYPALPARRIVDPVGAGDVFLAALAAARIQPRLIGGRIRQGHDLLLAAAAASLVLEDLGLLGVPDRAAVARRMAESGVVRRS
jgi:sugar/nucleoside kinase (ribokinase family)